MELITKINGHCIYYNPIGYPIEKYPYKIVRFETGPTFEVHDNKGLRACFKSKTDAENYIHQKGDSNG